jgi:hypothetical protein
LQHDIEKDLVALSRNYDRLGMQDLFVLAQLLYKLFDAVLIEKCLFFRRIDALVRKRDLGLG